MKRFALLLAMLVVASTAQAQTTCQKAAKLYTAIAQDRDAGITKDSVRKTVITSPDLSDDMKVQILTSVDIVYGKLRNLSADEVAIKAYTICAKGGV